MTARAAGMRIIQPTFRVGEEAAGRRRIVWAPPGDLQTGPFTLLLDGDLRGRRFPELLTRVQGASDPTEVSS